MNLEKMLIVIVLGCLMQTSVYFGLLRPAFGNSYKWVALLLSSLLCLCSILYIIFIHHSNSFTQNFSPALGILFVFFSYSLISWLIFALSKLLFPNILQFQKVWAIGLSLLACVSVVFALLQALQPPKLYTQKLQLNNLSTPLKVLQLSDLHIGGSYLTSKKLEKIITQSNALNPDLVLLTGDIIDAPSQKVLSQIQLLKNLKAKYGVFYALGNHEYFYDTDNILKELQKVGIKTLVNENFILEIDKKPVLNLAGVADFNAEKYQKDYPNKHFIYPDLDKTIGELNPTLPSILLSHQPKVIEFLPSPSPFSLILSGHTHGGQIFPFNYLVKLQQPFVKGFHTLGDTHIYINQGTAFWGIPMRLGSECEITLFELD